MAELYLVRHGQASFGTDDYDRLSGLGEQQSVWLGEYFAARGIAFDHVATGTLRRHRETADAILRGMGTSSECESHTGLDEYDFHALFDCLAEEHEGLKVRAKADTRLFYRMLKRALELWAEDRLGGPVPETWTQFQERVAAARIHLQRQPVRRILAVSSGGAIAALTQQVLGAPSKTAIALNMQLRNTSFSHYFFNAETFHLTSFNNIPHLDHPDRLASITYG
jgi:broad specificity phosphatase PhoE